MMDEIGRIIFKDGSEIPIKTYVKYSSDHIEFYDVNGIHYIFRKYVAKTVGGLKYMTFEFLRRIMEFEDGCPDPYSIKYIIDDDIDTIVLTNKGEK